MSPTWWKNSGGAGPIVGTKGAPILCNKCPCDPECTGNIISAILERQKAANVTSGDWLTGSTYALSVCQSRVNDMAPDYIDGTYTGGGSTAPILTDTYADSADTCAELYTLVLDLLTTKIAPPLTFKTAYNAALVTGQSSQAAALTALRATSMTGSSTAYAFNYQVYVYTVERSPGSWEARAFNRDVDMAVTGMTSTLSKTIRTFDLITDDGIETFDAQGVSNIVLDEYCETDNSGSLSAATTTYSTTIGLGTTQAPNDPGSGSALDRKGFAAEHTAVNFALIDWTFTYT